MLFTANTFCFTITRFLAAWIANYLQPYVGTFSGAHVRNNVDFKNKLQDFARINNRSDISLYSLDVQSLFTMVPLDDVLDFIGRKVNEGSFSPPIPFQQFRQLIEICTKNNYFEWSDDIYKQIHGVAMGSPLSPVLANLYMEYFESEILPYLNTQPLLWLRYGWCR